MKASNINNQDTKLVFLKKGTCSRTMFYILNREFGNPMEQEEQAADQLAGGILQQGYQCGLLWGTAFGIGAEVYHRIGSSGNTAGIAIKATRAMENAFAKRAGSADCEDIINMDPGGKSGALKMLVKGKVFTCFKLADSWAPEAISEVKDALESPSEEIDKNSVSCASEVVRRMGGSDKEAAIVAGLAGGIGLSGKGCGALSAAIWMKTLKMIREKGKNIPYPNPEANKILEDFMVETDYTFECHEICGRKFSSVEEHSAYVKNGGCSKLIGILAGKKK